MNPAALIDLATRKGELRQGAGLGAQRARLRTLIEKVTGQRYTHAGEAIEVGGVAYAAHLNTMPDIDPEMGF